MAALSSRLSTAFCGGGAAFGKVVVLNTFVVLSFNGVQINSPGAENQAVEADKDLSAMIPVDYVSELLLVAMSVMVAGGDEVVGLGEGMFTNALMS